MRRAAANLAAVAVLAAAIALTAGWVAGHWRTRYLWLNPTAPAGVTVANDCFVLWVDLPAQSWAVRPRSSTGDVFRLFPDGADGPHLPGLLGTDRARGWSRVWVRYPPVVAALGLAAAGLWRVGRRPAGRPGQCRRCGYDLRFSPERCPECGERRPTPTTTAEV